MDIQGFIELGKDLEQNPQTALAPDDMAPPLQTDTDYDPKLDPEMNPKVQERLIDHPHNALLEARLIRRRLLETRGINDALRKFWSTSDDHSFEAFQASGLNPGADEKEFRLTVKLLMKQGKLEHDGTFEQGGLNARGGGYGSGGRKEVVGPYGVSNVEAADPSTWSKELKAVSQEYGEADLRSESGTADESFDRMEDIAYEVAAGSAPIRHALIYGDPGVGKTFSVKKGVNEGIKANKRKARLMFKSGSIGASAGALIGILYAYRNNWVLVLDDNDAFLTSNNPVVQLMLKGVLDPDTKEVDIPPTQRKPAGVFAHNEMSAKGITENKVRISIDMERLREGTLHAMVGGRLIECGLGDDEAAELQTMFEESLDEIPDDLPKVTERRVASERRRKMAMLLGHGYRLSEADEDDDEDEENAMESDHEAEDLIGGEDDESTELPTSFTFDSSLIIVSNLREDQIDTAVLSRCVPFELNLTLDEFMDRLAKIYGKLAPLPGYSSLAGEMYDWCKKNAYSALGMVVASFLGGAKLFGTAVQINKKLQFRDLQKLAGDFSILANGYARRNGLKLDNPANRDRVAKAIMGEFYRGIVKYLSKAEKTPKM